MKEAALPCIASDCTNGRSPAHTQFLPSFLISIKKGKAWDEKCRSKSLARSARAPPFDLRSTLGQKIYVGPDGTAVSDLVNKGPSSNEV